MNISVKLLESLSDKLLVQWKVLEEEARVSQEEEILEIAKLSVEKSLELAALKNSVYATLKESPEKADSIRGILRESKLELRFAQRRMKRFFVSKLRNEKRSAKSEKTL